MSVAWGTIWVYTIYPNNEDNNQEKNKYQKFLVWSACSSERLFVCVQPSDIPGTTILPSFDSAPSGKRPISLGSFLSSIAMEIIKSQEISPIKKKDMRQPKLTIKEVAIGAIITIPNPTPEVLIPMASPRFFSNHLVMIDMLTTYTPPVPKAEKKL